jgi:uncharacterized protein (UPF0216 family)
MPWSWPGWFSGMESDGDGIGKTFWEVELRKLNESLPRVRKGLLDLLKEDSPSYTNTGGEVVRLDKAEIEEFSKLVPLQKRGDVSLPFIIMKEAGLKRGTYRIQGNAEEVRAINSALNRAADSQFLYRPDVLELSSRFPSLITFGYTL